MANAGLTPAQRTERDATALAAKKAAKLLKVNSSAEEMQKHEQAEAHKKAKKLNDKDGKAAKKNPLCQSRMQSRSKDFVLQPGIKPVTPQMAQGPSHPKSHVPPVCRSHRHIATQPFRPIHL